MDEQAMQAKNFTMEHVSLIGGSFLAGMSSRGGGL